ncbi:MAG: DUF937 domain-containing protein, partial [Granulosicoccus sp.]
TVSKQDDGMLGDIGNLLGGSQASNIASQGTSMLSSVLGDGALGKLAGVVASVAGVSRGNSSSLMGMLAPVIFSVIKKKVMEGGLNAGSLASMLSGQKDNIQAAMPQGFADQLQSQGFYESIGAPAPVATASPSAAPAPAQSTGGGGILKWAVPLVALAVLGWLGMQFFGGKQAEDAVANISGQASAVSDEAMQAARDAMPEGLNLDTITTEFSSVIGSTQETLTGITDVDSATAAVPAIQDAASKLGGLSDVITRLPEAAQGPIGSLVSNSLSSIQPLIEKVTAIPGVGAIIEPVIGPMMETLQGLGG